MAKSPKGYAMTRCERVYEIFKRLCNQPNIALMEAWQTVFATKDIFDVYFYLERLYNEIELLEVELNELYQSKLKPEELERFYGFSFQGENEDTADLNLNDDFT